MTFTLPTKRSHALLGTGTWVGFPEDQEQQVRRRAMRSQTLFQSKASPLLDFPALQAIQTVLQAQPSPDLFLMDLKTAHIERVVSLPEQPAPQIDLLNLQAPTTRGPLPDLPDQSIIHPTLGMVLGFHMEPFSGSEPMMHAQLAAAHTGQQVMGTGRASHYLKARILSVLEALERDAGMENQSSAPTCTASFQDLPEAMDPGSFGLYRPEQYHQKGFPFVPFDAAAPRNWVQGQHALSGKKVWLEQSLCFYESKTRFAPLVAGNSSGCAVGSTPEEALMHAVLEALERHAALKWWSSDVVPAVLDLELDPQSQLLGQVMERHGHTFRLFNLSGDLPVAVVMCQISGHHNGKPTLILTTGAGFHAQDAARQALSEALGLLTVRLQFTARDFQKIHDLQENFDRVEEVSDHLKAHFYPDPELQKRLEGGPAEPLPERVSTLSELLLKLQALGMDTYMVDQTTPLLSHWNLRCVRALITHSIPMHYGASVQRDHPLNLPDRRVHPFT
ncbi:YcaO-like family protein [Deinococcus misasensis]|uniref:YcaO-like family protein n=1 Tax=Deinococcus misasensis TaxID=392413 RepID=UPI00054D4723|nr:YcaO-like family protein [Deinococcus misasensis]